jgi:hypothetical protein
MRMLPSLSACSFAFASAVGARHRARTLAEFIAWCRNKPQDATLGIAGFGTTPEVRNAARLSQDIRNDFARWAEVVKRTGFKADA